MFLDGSPIINYTPITELVTTQFTVTLSFMPKNQSDYIFFIQTTVLCTTQTLSQARFSVAYSLNCYQVSSWR